MSEMKYRVTGPDGFDLVVGLDGPLDKYSEALALVEAFEKTEHPTMVELMRQAGYRAEPIEEPKMVTVRADHLRVLLDTHRYGQGGSDWEAHELRAALDSAS